MDINTLSGIEFEDLTHQLLLKVGFSVEQTKASRDGGIDLIAYSDKSFFKGKYIIQCKRYTGTVGEPIIRDLYGVVTNERANKGILITTGNFSNSALEFAKDKNLELIDGINLESLLKQYLSDINVKSRYFMDDPEFDKEHYLFVKKKFVNEYKELSQRAKKGERPYSGEFAAKITYWTDPILVELFSILGKASTNIRWLQTGVLEELMEIENIIPYNLHVTVGKGISEKKLCFSIPWSYNNNGLSKKIFNEPLLYALNNKFLYCIQELKDIRYVIQILYYTGLYTDFDKKMLDKYCQTDMLNDWLSVKDIQPHVKVDNLDEIVQELNWFIKNNEL